jgi:hypothetical protein
MDFHAGGGLAAGLPTADPGLREALANIAASGVNPLLPALTAATPAFM